MSGYYVSVTLHLLAALLWLGGMFFLAAVGAPILRRVEPPALRAELFRALGVGFRRVGWVAIGLLVVTGVLNLQLRGLLSLDLWGTSEFWEGAYGRALLVKLVTVTMMILLSAVHDFALGPAASRAGAGTPRALALRRWSAWIARINALLGLVLVIAAVRLARGG
jgi:putative copper export protein